MESTLTFAKDVLSVVTDKSGIISQVTTISGHAEANIFSAGDSILDAITHRFSALSSSPQQIIDIEILKQTPVFLLHHKDNLQWYELIYLGDIAQPNLIFVLRNVTDRQLAIQEAAHSTNVLRSILQDVPRGHWQLTYDLRENIVRKVQLSAELKALIGYKDEDLENTPEAWFSRVHPDDRGNLENLSRLKMSGIAPSFSTQYRIRHKAGQYISVYTHDSVCRTGQKGEVCWQGSAWDLRTLENAMRSAHCLGALVEASHCPIVGCDHAGDLHLWNTAALLLFQYSGQRFSQMSLYDLIKGEDVPLLQHQIKKTREGASVMPFEAMAIDAHGNEFCVLISVSNSGQNAGLSIVIQDISDLKRVQDELTEAKIQADSANKTKNIFLANVSHEVRTPLAAIKGFIEVIDGYLDPATLGLLDDYRKSKKHDREQALRLTKESAKLVKRVGSNVLTLERLISDLLDVSKLEAGKLDFENRPFDLRTTVEDLKHYYSIEAQKKNLQFNFTWDPRIHNHVRSDEVRIRQILTNLLSNAFKYTVHGHIDFNVCMPQHGDFLGSQAITFRVRDTGVGIPEENAKNLFQPFERGNHDTARRFGGTGIGLFLSHSIAEQLGGNVTIVDSAVGVGSTFEFNITLPCTMKRLLKNLAPTQKKYQLSGYQILVVEDNEDLRVLAETILENEGAHVDLSEDGLDGLTHAFRKPYDFILMDLQMPRMDGYEAVGLMKQNTECHAKVIAVTAHAMRGERERCIAAGFDAYLAKPMQRHVIVKTLLELISDTR